MRFQNSKTYQELIVSQSARFVWESLFPSDAGSVFDIGDPFQSACEMGIDCKIT